MQPYVPLLHRGNEQSPLWLMCTSTGQFNWVPGPDWVKLKTVLDYNSAVGREQQ
jgi:hypothetical protein